jgi:hypothetical protein
MSGDDNKRAVAEFVERCQNQHDLAFADEALAASRFSNSRLIEQWTSMDIGALRRQTYP